VWRRPPSPQGDPCALLAELLSAPRALITIGGVCFGGLGKSELALWLAERFAEREEAESGGVALVCHGYRGASGRAERVELPAYRELTERERLEALARWGDEALMMRWRAPRSVTVWAGGSWAERVARSEARWVICDGGLYRPELKPSAQLCIFNPRLRPLLTPLGPLCRPLGQFPRSVSWWCHQDGPLTGGYSQAYERCAPVLAESRSRIDALISPSGERLSSASLKGRRVQLWAGVARPRRILEALRSLGASLAPPVLTRNHAPFSRRQLALGRSAEPGLLRVCTYKDLPRVPQWLELSVLEPSFMVNAREG